ncbi:MAG: ABC transporter permease, partial [Sphingobacteriaceae bacterium]|nr:ABC transporter permease [Cytophagaceae bacterium]
APGYTDAQQAATFKIALKRRSTIVGVAASSDVQGRDIPANLFHGEGTPSNQHESMQMLAVDEDFVPALSMKLAAGRNFSRAFPTDEQEGFILNEEAVRQLGWPSPAAAVGKKFEWVMSDRVLKSGKVIGVVRDFNLKPLDSRVAPTVLLMEPNRFQYLYVRVRPGNPAATLDFLKQQIHQFYPDQPFQFTFLDETIQTMYRRETQLGAILGWFSALAILIGCLGIFGLATYTAQQRVKEIGIRKVLGASVLSVFALLSNDFLKLVVVALLIASPLAWWAMNQWLAGFAYHIHIAWWVFVLTSFLVMGIALLTVSFQSIKAALMNPVKSLRSE